MYSDEHEKTMNFRAAGGWGQSQSQAQSQSQQSQSDSANEDGFFDGWNTRASDQEPPSNQMQVKNENVNSNNNSNNNGMNNKQNNKNKNRKERWTNFMRKRGMNGVNGLIKPGGLPALKGEEPTKESIPREPGSRENSFKKEMNNAAETGLEPVWERQPQNMMYNNNNNDNDNGNDNDDYQDEHNNYHTHIQFRQRGSGMAKSITTTISSLSETSSFKTSTSISESKSKSKPSFSPEPTKNIPKQPPPDLHNDLDTSSWTSFANNLEYLFLHPDLIFRTVTATDPLDQSTPLHKAVWKAPPTLSLMLISLCPTSSELKTVFSHTDKHNNTPLHLCAANLPKIDDKPDLSVIDALSQAITKANHPSSIALPNQEGDTPLHLLLSHPDVSQPGKLDDALMILLSADHDNYALSTRDCTGATPLHTAIAHAATETVLTTVIHACPKAARMEDSRGMLPLHYVAAFAKTTREVVKLLLEVYPEGVCHQSVNGDTPLHLAISNASSSFVMNGKVSRTSLRIVELLMEVPQVTTEGQAEANAAGRDRDGGSAAGADSTSSTNLMCPILMSNREKLTPLHCCALFDAPPQLTKILMRHNLGSTAAAMTNSFGATPLHLAAAQPGVATSIATVLSLGTPDAAAVQDRLKRTPLHVAAQNIHATSLLIQALTKLYPEATAMKTQRGHLPLHLAAQSQAKVQVTKALINAYPQAAEARNKSSNTPLHDAAKYRASKEAVILLLETFPDAVYVQNQYGNLPLHCATAYQAASDVVQLLLEAWPEAASMQNRNQDTPLHYAAAYATSVDAVKSLIDAAPASVMLLNASGQSPIDRAKSNNSPKEIIDLLEKSAETLKQKAKTEGWGFETG